MSTLVSFVTATYAAPPVVTGVTASQRTGTKIVDISYNLVLDTGQSAFVEIWFSPDNGLTYPIRCMDVAGDVDANVTGIPAAKSAEWNAESDWNQKFTNAGKIRVIATYGNAPSGFNGSGNTVNGGNSGSHDANMKQVPMIFWEYAPNPSDPANFSWQDHSSVFNREAPGAIGMEIDPIEVTNGLWDEVVTWASQNNAGYTGLTLKGGDPDMPASNVTYWQAIKWCNARSEMDGLTPAYYTDADEIIGDINGNGQIDNGGVDTWYPYDTYYDPNLNGVKDAGEPYDDLDADLIFNPKEYHDFNNNGQYDSGLSQVFKQGPWITLSSNQEIVSNIKLVASGYRLPSYPVWVTATTGGNYKKLWPWGDESFPVYGGGAAYYDTATMQQKYRVSVDILAPEYNAPSKATDRQPNGFDLYDMLGNLAEWAEHVYNQDDGATPPFVQGHVYGGSYLGISDIGNSNFAIGSSPNAPQQFIEAQITGNPAETSNAIGFRCVVYLR